MKVKISILCAAVVIVGANHFANAQQSKIYRVGVLTVGSPDKPVLKGFGEGLKEAGYFEEKNLVLDIPAKKS